MKRRFTLRCVNGTQMSFTPSSDGSVGCARFLVSHRSRGDETIISVRGESIAVDSDGLISEIDERSPPRQISSGARVYCDGSLFIVTWMDEHDSPMPLVGADPDATKSISQEAVLQTILPGPVKADFGKILGDLIPFEAEAWASRVAEYGAAKYAEGNWKELDDRRLVRALIRHLGAIRRGEVFDAEMKTPHAAAIMCTAAFLVAKGYASGGVGWDPFNLTEDQIQALRDAADHGKMAK